MEQGLIEVVRDLVGKGTRSTAGAYARAVVACGPADHVTIASIDSSSGNCAVLGASDQSLITVGTSVSADTSTRLSNALAKRIWSSADFSREADYTLIVDQMARAAGLKSGFSMPLVVDDKAVAVICASSVRENVDWSGLVEAINHADLLLKAGLSLTSVGSRPLRFLVIHQESLIGHGLARLIELGLGAEVVLADGHTDPRLPALARSVDLIVADSGFVDSQSEAGGHPFRPRVGATPTIVVTEPNTDVDSVSYDRVVSRRAAHTELVPAIALALSGLRRSREPDVDAIALTSRELQLLSELDTGASFQKIAVNMGIATMTARSYSRGLFAKLDVHSRGEAVFEGRRRGYL
ncbi:helix-turn-helix transcriptional regulator [Rhodococcoides yunnanense]|uniref:helix-turn-helix transcriptional regulator n=1 Tax=Rhodococcoides yunnanense TaxID=278209 RepID=UPI0009353E31|nr:LuxR C-terminal-related transcriptional regulator [Rhodococcus yunnanensis]